MTISQSPHHPLHAEPGPSLAAPSRRALLTSGADGRRRCGGQMLPGQALRRAPGRAIPTFARVQGRAASCSRAAS